MEYISGGNKTGAIYAYSGSWPPAILPVFEARDSRGASASGAPPCVRAMVAQVETVKMSGGTNVAVAEFIGKNVSQADASIVADFLRTELVNTGLTMLWTGTIWTRAGRAEIPEQRLHGQECAVEMGRLLNVKKMLVGSLSNSWTLTIYGMSWTLRPAR